MQIYLADLTHTGMGIATEIFPLNIGLVASYAKQKFGPAIQITLFKYPDELKQALLDSPPHILGCSNYTWNTNLSYHFLRLAKSLDHRVLTVFGGTNYPFKPDKQKLFLEKRPELDIHTFYEGEMAFSNIIERYLSVEHADAVSKEGIPGCQFIDKDSGRFLDGGALPRIKDLDTIPSPYSTGLLDKFFDGKLTPVLETARGCPFLCNFCNAGDIYFNRVNLFSSDYVRQEWEYVAKKASQVGTEHAILCDNNFGMLPRDKDIAELMYELKCRYRWPTSLTAWTGKNSKDRVIQVTRRLGETLSINMSVQSMDEGVLKQIKRGNIKLDHYRAIAQELSAQGRPQHAEVIIPLPGETFQSYLAGLNELLDSGVGNIVTHTLQMLHGTPYRDDDNYIRANGIVGRYRIVPRNFGQYDGTYVFDTEEAAVRTNTFSFEEYIEARRIMFIIDSCYNGMLFEALKKYILSQGLRCSEWIQAIYAERAAFSGRVRVIFESFTQESMSELWESEEQLVRFYSNPSNYAHLLKGDAGGNVLWRHKAWMIAEAAEEWVGHVFLATAKFLQTNPCNGPQDMLAELEQLQKFILCSIRDIVNLKADNDVLSEEFTHDVLAWLQEGKFAPLAEYRRAAGVRLEFSYDQEQSELRKDAVRRYGADLEGVVKLLQRIGGIHRLTRKCSYAAQLASFNIHKG